MDIASAQPLTGFQPGGDSATHLVHVARQPIFGRAGEVVGYELLFRGRLEEVAASQRGTYATSHVIVNAFTEFGIGEVVGDKLCFINLTREFLVGQLTLPFGPDQVVLEVLESIEIDDEVLAGVTRLADEGYRIALDDFVWGLGHDRLFTIASYVKLDMLGDDRTQLARTVAACREYPNIQLVAERVETPVHLALADRFGCELRQGYALSRPHTMTTATLSPSKARRLELLGLLNSPDTPIAQICSVISADPALALRVLRASNSAAIGLSHRVSSVSQAVVMLGMHRIRQWATLMIVEDVTGASDDQLTTALARAKFCHALAGPFGESPETAFMLGLLTGVAQLMGVDRTELADQLPLAEDVAAALRGGGGRLGALLNAVDAYDRRDLDDLGDTVSDPGAMAMTYLDVMIWSQRLVGTARPASSVPEAA